MNIVEKLCVFGLKLSAMQQNLDYYSAVSKNKNAVPYLSNQHTADINENYSYYKRIKRRNQHAVQIKFVYDKINELNKGNSCRYWRQLR